MIDLKIKNSSKAELFKIYFRLNKNYYSLIKFKANLVLT